VTGDVVSQSPAPTVHCPDCGTRYKWRADFAGKELHCRCGCTFTPDPPEAAPRSGTTPSPEESATKGRIPFGSPTSTIQQALDAGEFAVKPAVFTDTVLPTLLLTFGFLLGAGMTWLVTGKPILFAACLGGLVAFELLVGIPVMLGALGWMASTFGEAFGSLREAAFKVASVSLGTGLIADALFGWFMTNIHDLAGDWPTLYVGAFGGGFVIYLLLQGLPLWAMYRVHPAMIAGVIACNFLLRFGLFFAAYYTLKPFWP